MKSKIAFIVDNHSDWGGSEELWAQTAARLATENVSVAVSMHARLPLHDRVRHLVNSGVKLWPRSGRYPLWRRIRRVVFSDTKSGSLIEIDKFLNGVRPELVVHSTGGVFPPVEWLELCQQKGLPFVTIAQANSEHWWFDDETATRYRQTLLAGLRCFFVSRANLDLAEKQIGGELPHAEIVRNPFNVDFDSSPPWPSLGDKGEIRLACVGRLDPISKGQDILLEALSSLLWKNRPWRLTLYGNGPRKNGIERLIERFELAGRVRLAGFVAKVEDIWAKNHVLVMPSRLEGLPLTMVEAMLCGRPVVATDVAGHSEIVDDGVAGFLADAPTVTSLARALEKLWDRRHDLRGMGEAAARSIRAKVPPDPAKVFSERLQRLLNDSPGRMSKNRIPSIAFR